MRRDDDDTQARRTRLQLLQKPDTVHFVHAQVGDDEVRTEAVQGRQRLVRRFHGLDFVTLGTQPNRKQAQQPWVVVDEQYLAGRLDVFGDHKVSSGFTDNPTG